MADLDPKEIALKNIPLMLIYVLAIVPLGLWFVLVGGGVKGEPGLRADSFDAKVSLLNKAERKINNLAKRIKDQRKNPEEVVYTGQHVDQYSEVHKEYEKQIKALRQIVLDQDQELEKWFEGVVIKKNGKPKANDFVELYRQKLRGLVKDYSDVVTPPEGGSPRINNQEPSAQQLKAFQKRYWIQKYLLASLQAGGKATREAGGPGVVLSQVPTFSDAPKLMAGGDQTASPVHRISVKAAFTCRFSDVPKILSNLLSQPITFEVVSLRIQKAAFTIDKSDIELRVEGRATTFNEPYYTGELDDHDQFKGEDKIHEYLPEPPIKVMLDLEVLDFTVEPPPPDKEEPDDEDLDDFDDLDDEPKKKK